MTLDSPRPRRYDQCDETCTVDCGHCKGQGRPTSTLAEREPETSRRPHSRRVEPVSRQFLRGDWRGAWPLLVAAGLVLGLVCFVVWRYPA